ncbi:MAG: helix-turn-helix domain-containing protein, partial [Pseudomonadota bacterium]|nr:helix-turn-helix domain-containing protein [Pseudomonadota bacterium]
MAIERKAPDRYLINSRLEDCEQLGEALQGWDLEFTQLDRGRSPVAMLLAGLGDVHFNRARFSRHYDQKGSAPQGVRTFALIEQRVSGVVWCGHEVSESTLLTFDSSGEFSGASRPGFEVYTLSFTENRLARTAFELGLPDFQELLGDGKQAINCSPGTMRQLRLKMRELCRGLADDPALLYRKGTEQEMEIELPRLILGTLAERRVGGEIASYGKRIRALQQATDYIEAQPGESLAVTDLCKLTGVSDRTLQHAFRERFGISPKAYLQAHRLAGARRELLDANPDSTLIANVANRWGFW